MSGEGGNRDPFPEVGFLAMLHRFLGCSTQTGILLE